MRYENSSKLTDTKSYLKGTLGLFIGIHSATFDRLKKYRDKIGAHSESTVRITSLPSHNDFETLFGFARDIYELVSGTIIDVHPAVIGRQVGGGFFKLMQSMGIDKPIFDFAENT